MCVFIIVQPGIVLLLICLAILRKATSQQRETASQSLILRALLDAGIPFLDESGDQANMLCLAAVYGNMDATKDLLGCKSQLHEIGQFALTLLASPTRIKTLKFSGSHRSWSQRPGV